MGSGFLVMEPAARRLKRDGRRHFSSLHATRRIDLLSGVSSAVVIEMRAGEEVKDRHALDVESHVIARSVTIAAAGAGQPAILAGLLHHLLPLLGGVGAENDELVLL